MLENENEIKTLETALNIVIHNFLKKGFDG